MPQATIRGVEINYEVLGERGAWVAAQPGGRRGLEGVKPLGQKLAEAGHRGLVYDRPNCGASGISFDGGTSKNEVWAEDLHALPLELDAAPAFIGGSSSGCRLALLAALRHPADARAAAVARHRRRLCRPALGPELLHPVHRGRGTGWDGSSLPHLRVRCEEQRQTRDHVESGERDARVEAQAARKTGACTTRREFRFIGFLDGPFGAFMEVLACFSRGESTRRPEQQANA